tara:strand:+ start:59 stop:187 length:129 start_codon:yes stop_codon:yes gene_type:complete
MTVHGSLLTPPKKLKGARFEIPEEESVEVQAIGLGTTQDVIR